MTSPKRALVFLTLGTLLFALAPPVLKLLTVMAGSLGFRMPYAINFCNVLLVGNFCAGLVVLAFRGPQRILGELVGLPRRTKWFLLLAAIVATIYPALLFTGLARTTVINVVLLSRFNGIVFLVLAFLFFGTRIRRLEITGYAIITIGVLVLIVVSNRGAGIGTGELFVLLATVFFALTEIASKLVLRSCSIYTYVFFRNLVSSIIFFVLGATLFGFEHFAHVFSRELWLVMVVYAGLAVVAAQVFWMTATRVLPVQTVANFQLLNPVFSIAFAFILLGEVPSLLQWLVIAIIVAGTLIPRLGSARAQRQMMSGSIDMSLAGR